MTTKNHSFKVPDAFDMAITNVYIYTQDENKPPALIIKGPILKKRISTGDMFCETLYTAHVMELLIPALKELKMKDPEELIWTIQHMQKRFTSDSVLQWPYNRPRWIPCP